MYILYIAPFLFIYFLLSCFHFLLFFQTFFCSLFAFLDFLLFLLFLFKLFVFSNTCRHSVSLCLLLVFCLFPLGISFSFFSLLSLVPFGNLGFLGKQRRIVSPRYPTTHVDPGLYSLTYLNVRTRDIFGNIKPQNVAQDYIRRSRFPLFFSLATREEPGDGRQQLRKLLWITRCRLKLKGKHQTRSLCLSRDMYTRDQRRYGSFSIFSQFVNI